VDGDVTIFSPKEKKTDFGFIFYPGGKVQYSAYSLLLKNIAKMGYKTFLIKMPFNLAVFNPDAAKAVIEKNSDIKKWAIGGHSLGGVMAANFAKNNTAVIDALVLYASYPSSNMSETGVKVLSLVGTLDGFVKKEKFENSKMNLPAKSVFFEIFGGNHSNFGDYGFQKGDNESSISKEEQQRIIIDQTVAFFEEVGK
jgi:dienelactone hydrolase